MSDIEGFTNAVTQAWQTPWYGDPMGILRKKLKLVKQELIKLNKANGNVNHNVQRARQDLQPVQDALSFSPTNAHLLYQEQAA
ncbi:hypothetical protein AgCh_024496 [Apium graveolens]